jgi:hypothetical protein
LQAAKPKSAIDTQHSALRRRSGLTLSFVEGSAISNPKSAIYLRFAYVLVNPLRLFVTVNVPSGCTDILIQYAGV